MAAQMYMLTVLRLGLRLGRNVLRTMELVSLAVFQV
jgi:hypothetical protein